MPRQQQAWQLSAKGDEFISKFTNYVEERSSSSSSSGINTTLILITPQNSDCGARIHTFTTMTVDRYHESVPGGGGSTREGVGDGQGGANPSTAGQKPH